MVAPLKLMKGHTFAKGKKKLQYPAIAEIKYDEIRLDVRLEHGQIEFRSYADKPLHNLSAQWRGSFERAFADLGFNRLDMGILVNRSFDDTYRYVRSSTGIPNDLLGLPMEFVLFDDPNMSSRFEDRLGYLDQVAENLLNRHGIPVIRPIRIPVRDEEEVMAVYGAAREQGFEGLMVKDMRHTYELGKRIYGWLKVKPEDDADGIITAINRAHSIEGVPLDRAGSIHVVCEDGSECDVPGIRHDLGTLMLSNPEQFIGQWCEFNYMERDRQGGYRHPRFGRIREEK